MLGRKSTFIRQRCSRMDADLGNLDVDAVRGEMLLFIILSILITTCLSQTKLPLNASTNRHNSMLVLQAGNPLCDYTLVSLPIEEQQENMKRDS